MNIRRHRRAGRRARNRRDPSGLRFPVRESRVRASMPRRGHHLRRPAHRAAGKARRQDRGPGRGEAGRRASARRQRHADCRRGRRLKTAEALRFPVILKAAHGGGGRGMRVVQQAKDFADAFEAARRESLTAFGSDEIFVEKFISRARHIEVQLLGDSHGNLVHLCERDCSVQRRHQKVVEIAPAPNLPSDVRQKICDAALAIGRAVQLRQRRHGRVPRRRRHERVLLHRGQSADPGRAHRHRRGDRHRHRAIADPGCAGRTARRPGDRPAVARSDRDARLRDPVPRDDRRPGEQVHARLRPDHALPLGGRHGHPARRRHGVLRRRRDSVLRFAAGEGDLLGAATSATRPAGWSAACRSSASAA